MKNHQLFSLIVIVSLSFLTQFAYGQSISNPTKALCQEFLRVPPNFSKIQQLLKLGANLDCYCEANKRVEFLSDGRTIVNFYATSISEATLKANSTNSAVIERVYVSPMQIALERQDFAFIRFLMHSGININYYFNAQFRPLEYALHTSNRTLTNFLIQNGADIKHINLGCVFDIDMLKYFIQKGANATTIKIDCALHDRDLAQQLINLNPDFKGSNLSNYKFDELLAQPKLLEFLIGNGLQVDKFNNNIEKRTLLSLAAETNNSTVVGITLRNKANVNLADDAGLTPIFYAVMNNHSKITRQLIQAGANVNVTIGSSSIQSPLSIAYKNKNEDLMQLLIQNGADIHTGNLDLLANAVMNNDTKQIEFLIKHGASPQRLVSLYGADYLFNHPKTFNFVIAQGAIIQEPQLMIRAVKEGQNDIATTLIKHKTGLSSIDDAGKTPLYYALEKDNLALAYQLLDGGADANHSIENYEPFLHQAVRTDNLILLQKLLQNDAEKDKSNGQGISALQLAVQQKKYQAAKILILSDATIHCEELFLAIKNEHFSMVKILVENGADLDCTKDGRSIVKYAKKENLSYQIEQYLKGKVRK